MSFSPVCITYRSYVYVIFLCRMKADCPWIAPTDSKPISDLALRGKLFLEVVWTAVKTSPFLEVSCSWRLYLPTISEELQYADKIITEQPD